ncbi:MAG: rod shape-determining protein MreC [Bacteroidales bacterium]|nr:rod shape-determining protein MreC [Bacteroidales bacterium]
MNNFIRFLERFHFVILFVVLFAISVTMYLNTTYYQKSQVGRLTKGVSGVIAGQFSNIGQYMNLKRVNIELTQENVALRNELERMRVIIEEVEHTPRLDSLSGAKYWYFPARVVNNMVNRRHNFITLNLGASNGVMPGMGVVCGKGIAGVVSSVSQNFCTVISVLNIDLKVSAKHSKSGIFGSLSWDGVNYREVVLRDIPLHVDVAVGDTIVTSGFSAKFPRDIPLGVISDFHNKDGNFYTIRVRLFADFKRLDYVYLVKSYEGPEINKIEITTHD